MVGMRGCMFGKTEDSGSFRYQSTLAMAYPINEHEKDMQKPQNFLNCFRPIHLMSQTISLKISKETTVHYLASREAKSSHCTGMKRCIIVIVKKKKTTSA